MFVNSSTRHHFTEDQASYLCAALFLGHPKPSAILCSLHNETSVYYHLGGTWLTWQATVFQLKF